MSHLDPETLARLVDDRASAGERGHLNRCRRCREELDALRTQTLALSHLPGTRPPRGAWERLEARLRTAGLIGTVGRDRRWGHPWVQAAAAVLLILTGTLIGISAPVGPGGSDASPIAQGSPELQEPPSLLAAVGAEERTLSQEEAAELVRLTERWYLEALLAYRDRSVEPPEAGTDPLTRFAALETLLAAGNAAVQELPADPFLNGLLVNMRAEREATLRGIRASTTHDWY